MLLLIVRSDVIQALLCNKASIFFVSLATFLKVGVFVVKFRLGGFDCSVVEGLLLLREHSLLLLLLRGLRLVLLFLWLRRGAHDQSRLVHLFKDCEELNGLLSVLSKDFIQNQQALSV